MRNFVITVNGKSYEVGVEEVGATASAPRCRGSKGGRIRSSGGARTPLRPRPKQLLQTEKSRFSFPRTH